MRSGRRRFLAALAVGATSVLAGCVSPAGMISMEPTPTDGAIGEAATRAVDDRPDTEEAALVEAAVRTGAATTVRDRAPATDGRAISFDWVPYTHTFEELGPVTAPGYRVLVSPNGAADPVAYDSLPPVDRRALRPARASEDPDSFETDPTRHYTDPIDRDESVLVPEPTVDGIEVNDTVYTVEVTETEIERTEYRLTVTELAPDLATFGERLREERTARLADLTEDEREVVAEAIEGRFVTGDTEHGAFIALGERLLETDPVYLQERQGEWLVRYEGERYWTRCNALRTTALVERFEATHEDWDESLPTAE